MKQAQKTTLSDPWLLQDNYFLIQAFETISEKDRHCCVQALNMGKLHGNIKLTEEIGTIQHTLDLARSHMEKAKKYFKNLNFRIGNCSNNLWNFLLCESIRIIKPMSIVRVFDAGKSTITPE